MPILKLGEHEFRCIERPPLGLMFDLAEAEMQGDSAALVALRKFVRVVVEDDEQERLEELFNNRRATLSIEDLNAGISALMEDYSGRPTERPSRSSSGPEPTGASSRVVSLSRGTVRVEETSSQDGQSAAS